MAKTFSPRKITALLYSTEQKCFHIETLEEWLINQMGTYLRDGSYQGFELIGVFETGLEANDWTEKNYDWRNRCFVDKPELTKLLNL